METEVLSFINVDDAETWQNKNFQQLDADWVYDETLADAIDLVKKTEFTRICLSP